MTLHFSKSTNGFFDSAIHGDLMPGDAVEVSIDAHSALLEGQSLGRRIVSDVRGYPVLATQPHPEPDQVRKMLSAAVQRHLDVTAQASGYDDIKTAVTYADEPAVPRFEAEGKALRAWRSLVWESALKTLEAGSLPSADKLIASLPGFVAP